MVFPGKCAILKNHGRVLCFKRKRRVLCISSSVRSPRIFVSGLWSVTTIKSEHPCVKNLVCSPQTSESISTPHLRRSQRIKNNTWLTLGSGFKFDLLLVYIKLRGMCSDASSVNLFLSIHSFISCSDTSSVNLLYSRYSFYLYIYD